MPSWKKIITSGSSPHFTAITVDNTVTAGVFTGTFRGALSSSAQIKTEISGAFTSTSSSLASRIATAESELGNTLISGSAQIATAISGAFGTTSSSLASRIATAESELGNTLLSGSTQIATEISGAFTSTSSSLASRIVTNEGYLNQNVKTTASPTFAGLTTTGDVTVQGTLTAETYVVSSSITNQTVSFSSGSTAFGDSSDDTHTFTGEVIISGSTGLNVQHGNISGSTTSTGSFGELEIIGTGSFAGIKVGGGTFTSKSLASGGSGVSSYNDLSNVPVGLVSGSAQIKTEISGAFYDVSSSLASRVATAESELGNTLISGSAQIASAISGSFVTVSSSLASRIATAESELGNTLLSGSAQIKTEISGAFTTTSSSLASRIATAESELGNTLISGSAQIKTQISGAFGNQRVATTDNVTFNKIITTAGPDTFGGNVTIAGNLTLQGSQSSAETLVINDQFGFFASGSEGANVDAGLLVQSGSVSMTGSALYHDITGHTTKNPKSGRWAVAKDVKADATAATPKAYVTTVVTATDGNDPDSTDVHYGVGEMYVNSDGEIWIYTGS